MLWIWSICTGVTHGVSHPPPKPECNLKVPPPVAVPGANDEDGEDVSRPTVEVHVELAKTVGKLLNITNISDHWCIPVAHQVDPDTLANDIGELEFCFHLEHFLQEQLESGPDANSSPFFYIPDKICIYSSALTTFYVPSDLCGTGGMHHEHIHAVTSWRGYKPQCDSIFVNTDECMLGMLGLYVAQVKLFFSVTMNCKKYPCALRHWYSLVGDSSNKNTGLWVIEWGCGW